VGRDAGKKRNQMDNKTKHPGNLFSSKERFKLEEIKLK
jgi:hypothetical protein